MARDKTALQKYITEAAFGVSDFVLLTEVLEFQIHFLHLSSMSFVITYSSVFAQFISVIGFVLSDFLVFGELLSNFRWLVLFLFLSII